MQYFGTSAAHSATAHPRQATARCSAIARDQYLVRVIAFALIEAIAVAAALTAALMCCLGPH
jgi:hypothetical protein